MFVIDVLIWFYFCRPLLNSEGELESGEITSIYKQVRSSFCFNYVAGSSGFADWKREVGAWTIAWL